MHENIHCSTKVTCCGYCVSTSRLSLTSPVGNLPSKPEISSGLCGSVLEGQWTYLYLALLEGKMAYTVLSTTYGSMQRWEWERGCCWRRRKVVDRRCCWRDTEDSSPTRRRRLRDTRRCRLVRSFDDDSSTRSTSDLPPGCRQTSSPAAPRSRRQTLRSSSLIARRLQSVTST